MATLESFFVKVSRPPVSAQNSSEDGASYAAHFEPKIISVEGNFNDGCTSDEKRPSKRVRQNGPSSDRLKTKKKLKIASDSLERNESKSYEQDEVISIDCELHESDDKISAETVIKQGLHEISYEDFLAANEPSCKKNKQTPLKNDDQDKDTTFMKSSPTVTHAIECETPEHDSKERLSGACASYSKTNQLTNALSYDCKNDDQSSNVHSNDCKDDQSSLTLSNICEDDQSATPSSDHKDDQSFIASSNDHKDDHPSSASQSASASKDIRSFFGKTTARSTSQNHQKSCATMMKVKAEVHFEPNAHTAILTSKPSADNNKHTDLARWQRANIVITNADLDIEILDVCSTSADARVGEEDNEVILIDKPANMDDRKMPSNSKPASDPAMFVTKKTSCAKSPVPILEIGFNNSKESVIVDDSEESGKKSRKLVPASEISERGTKDDSETSAHKNSDQTNTMSTGSDCFVVEQASAVESSNTKNIATEPHMKEALDENCGQTATNKLQRYIILLEVLRIVFLASLLASCHISAEIYSGFLWIK